MESKPSPDKPSDSHFVSLILAICVISLVFIYMVYARNFVFGSIRGKWVSHYFSQIKPIPLWIPLVILVLLGMVIFIGSKQLTKHEKWVVTGCLIAGIAIQILIQQTYPLQMGELIKSDISTSFYSVAQKYSPYELLSKYSMLAPTFPLHARTNLPGKVLLFQFLLVLTSSTQVMGYLIIVLSSLGGLILYGMIKQLFKDKIIAFYALVLYLLIPCKQFFFPTLNTVTPVFILLCLYLFVLYLEKKKCVFLFLLGISLYALILFEPSPLVMGALFIGIFIYYLEKKRVSKKEVTRILLLPALSFLVIYLLFVWVFSFDLWTSFQYMLKDAINFNATANREYGIWLGENSKAFFFDAGLPVMMIFIYYTISLLSKRETYKTKFLQWPPELFYILFLFLTFLVVLLLGINRGETTRLWIYLAVFFQVPAAIFIAKIIKNNLLFFILAVILIVQTLVTVPSVAFMLR